MQTNPCFNETALRRLAAVMLRQSDPTSAEEGRSVLSGALGVYDQDRHIIDRAVSDYFRKS